MPEDMNMKETDDTHSLSFTMREDAQDQKIHVRGVHDIDHMGKYQLMVLTVVSFPLLLSAAFAVGYVFTAGEVDYRCLVPECESFTAAVWNTSWTASAAPAKHNLLGSCERFVVKNDVAGKCSATSFTDQVQQCDRFVYSLEERTILNEWDITCDENRWKLSLVGTINNVGQLVGLMFAGYFSDRYGRRTLLVTETFCSGIVGIIQSFSTNYWMFLAMEFSQSVTSAGMYSTGFILGLEMVGEKRRVLNGTILCCMYAVGEMLLGLTAMKLKAWRNILRVFFVPALLAVFLPLMIPESVRWLVANGKHEKVKDIYKTMAKINGTKYVDPTISIYNELNSDNQTGDKTGTRKVPVREALSRPKLLIRLLICCLCWLTNTFVYYGLSLNSVSFAGNKYINFILVSFVEIPAYFLSWLLIDNVGRKPTLAGSFFFSGIFCLGIQYIPRDTWSHAPLVMYMGGKACITMAFATVYVYTAEMFPTTVRHFLLSICSMTGRIGSILAPQTRLLATIMQSLPLLLFGSMGIIAGFVSLAFPETLGHKLPDTMLEAENIGQDIDEKEGEA